MMIFSRIAFDLFEALHKLYLLTNDGLTFQEWKEKVYEDVKRGARNGEF